MTKHVAVIGAGIAGLNIAYQLQKQGFKVTVYERETAEAMQCSFANGGQISVCNSTTWHTWDNVLKGMKWMLQKDAPFYIKPSLSMSKALWIAGFLKHTFSGVHERLTIETIKLGQLSSTEYEDISLREGLFFDQLHHGMLHVYTSETSLQDALKYTDLFSSQGVTWQPVEADKIINIDRNLSHFQNVVGGIYTPEDWTGDIKQYCTQIRDILEKRGVTFVFNANIERVTDQCVYFKRSNEMEWYYDDEDHPGYFFNCTHLRYTHEQHVESGFSAVVISSGYEIDKFASENGEWLNVYPVKGYSVTIENAHRAPKVSLLDDDKKIVSATFGTRFRIAGTAELDGDNRDIKRARIEPLLRWCQENFDIDIRQYSSWCCHRPMASDMMPVFRRSKKRGVYYHGAHGHLGWTMSAGTAKLLAEQIKSDLM